MRCDLKHDRIFLICVKTLLGLCRSLWTAAYPHEPFDVDVDVDVSSTPADDDRAAPTDHDYSPRCGYDLAAAIQRQAKFHYQVVH